MNDCEITGKVQKFPGKMGWYYVPLQEEMSADFREIVKAKWPALLKAGFTTGKTTWESSIMPIKDGPLFIALPSRIRKAESIIEDSIVTIHFTVKEDPDG